MSAKTSEPPPPEGLRALQEQLGDAFCQFESIVEHAQHGATADALVVANSEMSARERADIYREQFWLRHRDALYEDYPALSHYLGQEAFERMCRDYLRAHPSRSFTLRDLGNDIATFASTYRGFPDEQATGARDLIAFELAFIDLFDGPDLPHADPDKIAQLAPEAWASATLVLHPQLTLLSLSHTVHSYRTTLRRTGDTMPRQLHEAPTWLAMYRSQDLKVRYLPIEKRQHELLTSLRDGVSLLEACEALASTTAEADQTDLGATLRAWFHEWGRRGWITDVLTQPKS